MGTSYQNLLPIGEPRQVRQAASAAGIDGLLVPVGPARVVILPREGDLDFAPVHAPARRLSTAIGAPLLTNEIVDSGDLIDAVAIRPSRSRGRVA